MFVCIVAEVIYVVERHLLTDTFRIFVAPLSI